MDQTPALRSAAGSVVDAKEEHNSILDQPELMQMVEQEDDGNDYMPNSGVKT